jgi:hypothetical protein
VPPPGKNRQRRVQVMRDQAGPDLQTAVRYKNLIAGRFTDAEDGNPVFCGWLASGRVVSHHPLSAQVRAGSAVAAVRGSFTAKRRDLAGGKARLPVLRGAARTLRRSGGEHAPVDMPDTPEPLATRRGEVMAAVELRGHAAGAARALHGDGHAAPGFRRGHFPETPAAPGPNARIDAGDPPAGPACARARTRPARHDICPPDSEGPPRSGMTVTATIRDECRHPLVDGGLIPGTSARPVPGLGVAT